MIAKLISINRCQDSPLISWPTTTLTVIGRGTPALTSGYGPANQLV